MSERQDNMIYCAYEGDDLLGKFDTREEAEEELRRARKEAGTWGRNRIYRVSERSRRGGE